MAPRVSIKAVILEGNRLLTIQLQDQYGVFYCLPGGGQEKGETIEQALRRECQEEASVEVHIHHPLYIRDYIGKNHEFADEDPHTHQIEIMFYCQLAKGSQPAVGHVPDCEQLAVIWLELDQLHHYRLYPKMLISHLQQIEGPPPLQTIYLGDVN